MMINIQDDILKLHALGLLDKLLSDKTTKAHILWATDAYCSLGAQYKRDAEITSDLVTGCNASIIQTRARKEIEQQSERTRQHAEVFTPQWMCARMNDYADEAWFGYKDVFTTDGKPTPKVIFPEGKNWKQYIDSRRMEITCGEAPYLVSRYDVETGEVIPIGERIGLLDRKLRVVNENAADEDEWMAWAVRAFWSIYGFEFQGDNVLIARVNLLMTFEEYLWERWNRRPSAAEYQKFLRIVVWNLWQMDGLTGAIPYGTVEKQCYQYNVFTILGLEPEAEPEEPQKPCRIFNWVGNFGVEFFLLPARGKQSSMKFDFIIGNPPYQEETSGDNKGFAPPIYHKFLEGAYEIGDVVEMIHPARFLFNAGSTPKQWNEKMLNDPHLKVVYYEPDSTKVFANADIKGGVAVTYRDKNQTFEPIQVFSAYPELNTILSKVSTLEEDNISSIIFTQNRFDLERLYLDYPELKSVIGSDGKDRRFRNNIFEKVSAFLDTEKGACIHVLGLFKGKRVWKFIPEQYVDKNHKNLNKWKVFVPTANGSGILGEVLSSPLIGSPCDGYTQSFISIGALETEQEAMALLKYVKSKFLRTLLGLKKVTQDNPKSVWDMIPLQNFTSFSDIDWSKSIPEIDQQLYQKYSLDEQEIEFIETHAKEME